MRVTPLLDLADPRRAADLQPIDDVIMGGSSHSRARPGDRCLVFEGEVSLADGGGFASIRSRPLTLDLSGFEAVALRVRGDGRTYKLNLRTDGGFDGVTYQARFETEPGAWRTITVPLAAFAPTWRGRIVAGHPPLDPARIATIGFMVSDRQAGPFHLEVAWLGGASPEPPESPPGG